MTDKDTAPQDTGGGKRLLLYGMFALVVVTMVSIFLVVWLLTAPLTGNMSVALQSTLIIGVITIIACVIAWFVYTKLILKE